MERTSFTPHGTRIFCYQKILSESEKIFCYTNTPKISSFDYRMTTFDHWNTSYQMIILILVPNLAIFTNYYFMCLQPINPENAKNDGLQILLTPKDSGTVRIPSELLGHLYLNISDQFRMADDIQANVYQLEINKLGLTKKTVQLQ